MVEARLFSQCRNGVEAASSIPSGCEAGRPWGREHRFLSLHRAAGRVGRGSLWFVCQTKVVDSLFLSLLRLPLFSHHQDELWLTKTYLPGFIYIYTYIWCFPEKAMAPHSSTSCLENPMDGGAW